MPWGWIFAQIIRDRRSTLLKWWSHIDVWPFYGEVKFASLCICMGSIYLYGKNVENYKQLLLWSHQSYVTQISCGASLGQGNERLLKWSPSTGQDGTNHKIAKIILLHIHWPFYSKVIFAFPCICVGLIQITREKCWKFLFWTSPV